MLWLVIDGDEPFFVTEESLSWLVEGVVTQDSLSGHVGGNRSFFVTGKSFSGFVGGLLVEIGPLLQGSLCQDLQV